MIFNQIGLELEKKGFVSSSGICITWYSSLASQDALVELLGTYSLHAVFYFAHFSWRKWMHGSACKLWCDSQGSVWWGTIPSLVWEPFSVGIHMGYLILDLVDLLCYFPLQTLLLYFSFSYFNNIWPTTYDSLSLVPKLLGCQVCLDICFLEVYSNMTISRVHRV